MPGKKNSSQGNAPFAFNKVVSLFAACPRCSYFLAGYRMIHDDLEDAVREAEGDALRLSWTEATRVLVAKSYGLDVDIELLHFAGICELCRRVFSVNLENGSGETPKFTINIKP